MGQRMSELSPDLDSLPELRAKEVEVVWGRMAKGRGPWARRGQKTAAPCQRVLGACTLSHRAVTSQHRLSEPFTVTSRLNGARSQHCLRWNCEKAWASNGNPLQYSCLENSMDRIAWRATVHGVAKSQT